MTTKYESGSEGDAYGYQNFSYAWSGGEAGGAKMLRCSIGGVGWNQEASGPLPHTIELRGQGHEPPTSILFGDSKGHIEVVATENGTLSRPVGTVILSAPSSVPRTQSVRVQVMW